MKPHPSEATLRAFLEGTLTATEERSIETHVEDCEKCEQTLTAITEASRIALLQPRDAVGGPASAVETASLWATIPPEARPPAPPILPTETIAGHEILGVLGRGGMGVVYKARQPRLNRIVALKMILSGLHAGSDDHARFQTEAKSIARLQHPNIVQIFEVGEDQGQPYLCLEYVDGVSLAQHLKGQPQAADEAAGLVATLAVAMQHAHALGIVHRDLKPANVLLQKTGDKEQGTEDNKSTRAGNNSWGGNSSGLLVPVSFFPKITDFGLAKQLDDHSGQTHTGTILGTPSYMAPEQASGRLHEISPLTDVYALGAILYEMLTGRPPFRGASAVETLQQVRNEEAVPPSRLRGKLPRDLEVICLKCLRKDPRQRYHSAHELAEDLRRFLTHQPIRARAVGWIERVLKMARRHPARAGLAIFIIVAVGALIWGWTSAFYNAKLEGTNTELEQEKVKLNSANGQLQEQTQLAEDARSTAVQQRLIAQRGRARLLQDAGVNEARFGDVGYSLLLTAQGLNLLPAEFNIQAEALRRSITLAKSQLAPLQFVHKVEGVIRGAAVNQKQKLALVVTDKAAIWYIDLNKPGFLLDPATNQPRRIFLTEDVAKASVAFVDFRPDGKQFAVTTSVGKIHVFDTASGCEMLQFQHRGRAMAASYSADGRSLVVAAHLDKQIPESDYLTTYDAETGAKKQTFPIRDDLYMAVFSSDDRWLACCGEVIPTTRVTLFNPKIPNAPPVVLEHPSRVFTLAFSPDGKTLVTGAVDGEVRFWDLETRTERGSSILLKKQARLVTFSEDGRWLLTGSEDRTARLWDVATRRPTGQTLHHLGHVRSGGIVADLGRLITADFNGDIRIWGLPAPEKYTLVLQHPASVLDVDFSPDGQKVVTGCLSALKEKGAARVWDLNSLNHSKLPHGADALVVRFRPTDPNIVVTGGNDKMVRIWDVGACRELNSLKHASIIFSGNFSRDGRWFAFGGRGNMGNQFRVWDFQGRHELPAPKELGGIVYSFFWNVNFSGDGRLLTVGGPEGLVWKVPEGRLLRKLWHDPPLPPGKKEDRPDTNGEISRDGKWAVVFGREKNKAVVWDLQQDNSTPVFIGGSSGTHKGELTATAFHPNRPILATASADGTVRLWFTDGTRFLPKDLQHESAVETVDFSPDGRFLVTGTRDGLVRVWSTNSGEWTGALWIHDGPVTKVAFSPKEQRVVTASRDRTARVCSLPEITTGDIDSLLAELESITGITVVVSLDGAAASFSPPSPLSAEDWRARQMIIQGKRK